MPAPPDESLDDPLMPPPELLVEPLLAEELPPVVEPPVDEVLPDEDEAEPPVAEFASAFSALASPPHDEKSGILNSPFWQPAEARATTPSRNLGS